MTVQTLGSLNLKKGDILAKLSRKKKRIKSLWVVTEATSEYVHVHNTPKEKEESMWCWGSAEQWRVVFRMDTVSKSPLVSCLVSANVVEEQVDVTVKKQVVAQTIGRLQISQPQLGLKDDIVAVNLVDRKGKTVEGSLNHYWNKDELMAASKTLQELAEVL